MIISVADRTILEKNVVWMWAASCWEGVLMLHDKTKIAPTARETEDSQDEGRSTYLLDET